MPSIVHMKKFIRIIKDIILSLEAKIKYYKYIKNIEKKHCNKFLIFNTPIHGNIGDHAIIFAIEEILKKHDILFFEIPTSRAKYYLKLIENSINSKDILAITGGGFLGSQWMEEMGLVYKILENFSSNQIIIFPCTIFFKEDDHGIANKNKSIELFNKINNLTIFAREIKTYNLVKESYPKAKVFCIPDIVLSLDNILTNEKKQDILLCLRSDVESILDKENKDKIKKIANEFNKKVKETDTVVNYSIKEFKRKKELINKLEEFASSSLVITDRLHGMVFASITNTPCIVLSNYNYKVEGVYEWIKKIDHNILFERNIENIKEDIEQLLKNDFVEKKEKYDFRILDEILEEIKNG